MYTNVPLKAMICMCLHKLQRPLHFYTSVTPRDQHETTCNNTGTSMAKNRSVWHRFKVSLAVWLRYYLIRKLTGITPTFWPTLDHIYVSTRSQTQTHSPTQSKYNGCKLLVPLAGRKIFPPVIWRWSLKHNVHIHVSLNKQGKESNI